MAFFKFTATQEQESAPEKFDEFEEARKPTHDTRRAMALGREDISQLVTGALEYGARKLDLPVLADTMSAEKKRSKDFAGRIESGMSEEGRKAINAPVFATEKDEGSIADAPASSLGLKSMRMVMPMLASAIPGTVLARVGLGTIGVAAGTGATGAALGVGDVANAVSDEIDGLSHEELMNGSKVYRVEIEGGASPEDARAMVKEIAQDEAVPLGALINFATNAFGPEALLAKALGGQMVRKGLGRGLAEGLTTGAATEAVEGGTTAYLQEEAGQAQGGKAFNWMDVAKQASEEALMGGLFGGGIGGATNIKGRSKAGGPKAQAPLQVEATQAVGPTAVEAVALAPATAKPPSPKPAPAPQPVAAGATPVGPPTVQAPGTETPPPGAKIEKTPRNYKKKVTEGSTGGTVQAAPPIAPDPTQAAAIQPSKPLVRRRAQAELATDTAPPSPPPNAVPAPVAAPVETLPVQTPPVAAAPVEAPPVQAPVETPAQPSPPIVLGKVKPTGRILPDLQAQARREAELEKRAAEPDEVAARGTRYQQTEASVTSPAEHQAWRRQMFREAKKGTNPSKIAVEATKIRATRGIDLPEPAKERLRELHREWLAEKGVQPVQEKPTESPRGQRGQFALPGGLVVKDAKKFVLEAARSSQEANANPTVKDRIDAFKDILQAAPNRDDINKQLREHSFVQRAAVLKEKLDQGTATEDDINSFERAEREFISLSQEELDAQTRDIEAGVSNKGGTGAVEVSVKEDTAEEGPISLDDTEVETKASKIPVIEKESSGPASDVRRPVLTDEEKAALVAKVSNKQKAAESTETTGSVRRDTKAAGEQLERKSELPKKVTKKPSDALKQKREEKSKRELIDRIGWSILDMHRAAEDLSVGSDERNLLNKNIENTKKKLLDTFGQEEHDRVSRTITAALTAGVDPSLRSSDVVQKLLARRRAARTEKVQGFDDSGKPTQEFAEVANATTVAKMMDEIDFHGLADNYASFMNGTPELARRLYRMILPRIYNRVGNVRVTFVKDEDWNRIHPSRLHNTIGYYSWQTHNITLRESLRHGPETELAETILHEATHAATSWALIRDEAGADNLRKVLDEINIQFGSLSYPEQVAINYALTNERELVAEAFANPKVQRVLAKTPISSNLAKELGLGEHVPRTVWGALVDIVRRMLGVPANMHTALEAVMFTVHNVAGVDVSRPDTSVVGTYDPFAQDLEYMAEALSRDPTLAFQARMLDTARQNVDDRLPRSRTRSWALNLSTLHQMTQMADRYFPKGMAVKVSDIVEKTRLRRAELIGAAQDRVVTRLHQLQKKYQGTDKFAEMEQIADRATSADIHPDVPLSDPRNKHVKKSAKWLFARKEHAELYKRWQAMPADLKQAWHDARTYLVDQQNSIAELHLGNIIEQILGRTDEQLARRIFNGTVDENDRALFRTNRAMRAIANARELKKIKGVYFPKMRRGDYVITGRYKLPQWEANKVISDKTGKPNTDGRYAFHNKKDYEAFVDDMRKRGITITGSTTYSVDDTSNKKVYTYTDPVTGVTVKDKTTGMPKEFRYARGDTDTHTVYEARIQDKLVEMHESEHAARQAERALKADTNFEVSGVEKRKEMNVNTSKATSRQIRSAIRAMEQSGNWSKMSDAQKAATKQAFLELSLSFVASTAPQNRSRPRRNVIGASKDLVRNVAEYAAASSGSIANLENMPELEKAFDDLEAHADHNRNQTSDITLPRSQLLEKMRENAYAEDGTAPTKRNRLINAVLALSFMDKLVSPAYHMINSLQPWMVSAPVLGGRHGFAKATYELGRAYNSMGYIDTLKSGAKDTKRAVFDLLEGTTDYMSDIRKKLGKQKDGAELADMLDYLHDRGLIDKDAGLEVSELINAGSRAEHVLHRVDHVVRQFGTAVEVVNRVTTAIAAYRMERARGASVDDARVYAQETVANTQGNYSMSNAPKIFKHPLGRTVLQFKKFAQLQYFLLSKLTYNAFKGASKAERIEAAKSLAVLLTAHVAMAGATGLPTEPIKIPWMLLSMFLPMPSWEEIEQGATEYAQDFLGDNLGDAIAHGLPRLAGIDLNSRVGLNSLIMFGEPRNAKEDSVYSWILQTVMGAPFALGAEKIKGVRSLMAGDFGEAAEQLMPFKLMSDSVKAYRRAVEGKVNARGETVADPWGMGEAFVQALGFKPTSDARRQESTAAFYNQAGRRKAERQELLDEYAGASDRAAVRKKIFKYNASVPKDARITDASLKQLLSRKKLNKKKGYVQKGVYGGKLNKDLLEKYVEGE